MKVYEALKAMIEDGKTIKNTLDDEDFSLEMFAKSRKVIMRVFIDQDKTERWEIETYMSFNIRELTEDVWELVEADEEYIFLDDLPKDSKDMLSSQKLKKPS